MRLKGFRELDIDADDPLDESPVGIAIRNERQAVSRHERRFHARADVAGEEESQQDDVQANGKFQGVMHRWEFFLYGQCPLW